MYTIVSIITNLPTDWIVCSNELGTEWLNSLKHSLRTANFDAVSAKFEESPALGPRVLLHIASHLSTTSAGGV